MPFKVLRPPPGLIKGYDFDTSYNSANSITLASSGFRNVLAISNKENAVGASLNSSLKSQGIDISESQNDSNISKLHFEQKKKGLTPPPVPPRKNGFNRPTLKNALPSPKINAGASTIDSTDVPSRRFSSASSASAEHTKIKSLNLKLKRNSLFAGKSKGKLKAEDVSTLQQNNLSVLPTYANRWFVLEAEEYRRAGFPAGKLIGPRDVSFLKPAEVKRQETIFELISTERDYVRDIQLVCNLFLKPIRDGNLLNSKEISCLFSNIEQLLPINQELLKGLEAKRIEGQCVVCRIADVFLQLSQYFKIYTQYCMNYQDAITLLAKLSSTRSPFTKFLNQVQANSACQGLGLSSFLLKPVQRLCKYPLLLKEVQKHTPKFHSDETDLTKALNIIGAVVQKVNEGGKFREDQLKLLELHSKLIWEASTVGGLTRNPQRRVVSTVSVRKANKKQRYLILLNDALLICKPELLGHRLHVRQACMLETCPITLHEKSGIMLEGTTPLYFETEDARDTWYRQFGILACSTGSVKSSGQVTSGNATSSTPAVKANTPTTLDTDPLDFNDLNLVIQYMNACEKEEFPH